MNMRNIYYSFALFALRVENLNRKINEGNLPLQLCFSRELPVFRKHAAHLCILKHLGEWLSSVMVKFFREEVAWWDDTQSPSPSLWKESHVKVSINVISRSPHGHGMDSLRARFISVPGEIVAGRDFVPRASAFRLYAFSPCFGTIPSFSLLSSPRISRLVNSFLNFNFYIVWRILECFYAPQNTFSDLAAI